MELIVFISICGFSIFTLLFVLEKLNNNSLKLELLNYKNEIKKLENNNAKIVSQKKSSETRIGNVTENIIPFLKDCPYNPRDMNFLGQPLDYLIFDLDEGKIVFLEVKTGKSKVTKKQKTIKNLIENGQVFYEEMRVTETGVKYKKGKK